jgi:glutathionylspermidine synthase
LIKVIGRYLTDERYRGLFKFDPLLEQMILSPCGYESLLPIARIDLFYNEETGDFKFCEFNTDGTSGMAEETDIIKGLSETFAFNKFAKDLDVVYFELYKSWVKEFTAVYNTYEKKNNHPVIAIVDFLESGVSNEFEIFRREFESFGYQCMIADIRQLEFKDRYFYYNGKKIDAIYRRAVTGEILAKKDTSLSLSTVQ